LRRFILYHSRALRIRVLTYNIHRAIGIDGNFRPERIAAVIQHHEPDIAMLQEVDHGAPRSRRLDLACELTGLCSLPHVAVGYNVRLSEGQYGNATLSRWPIEESSNIDLTIGRRKKRGALFTKIHAQPHRGGHADGRILHVFNAHLGLSARERHQQIAKLAKTPAFEGLDVSTACIVGGDFNDWRSLLFDEFVRVLGFHCSTTPGRRALRTYPSLTPQGPLDRLYCRGPLRTLDARVSRLRTARMASDHLPVVVDFEMRPVETA
jgi:endonuclease/exonuclease/phosphatase family metal-dependent hydrolase